MDEFRLYPRIKYIKLVNQSDNLGASDPIGKNKIVKRRN